MFEGAVVVDGRGTARRIPELGVRCDDTEIPEPVDEFKPDGWWAATAAHFEGAAHTQHINGALADRHPYLLDGPCSLYVGGGRLAAIISPLDTTQSAVWLVAPVRSLRRDAIGSQGLRGRPETIEIKGDDWLLAITDVSAVFRHSGQYQTGQEAGLLKALDTAAQQQPTAPSADAPDARRSPPEDQRSRRWSPEQSLAGLHRLYLEGEPNPATALVDRGLTRGDQMRALSRVDWAPPAALVRLFRATEQNSMPGPFGKPFVDGRVLSPFFLDFGAVADLDEQPSNHPVYRYLWPSRNGEDLALDKGESVVQAWTTPSIGEATLLTSGKRGGPSTLIPNDLESLRVRVTTGRVVALGNLKQPPPAAREDYSLKLALVSPMLDDLRASARQFRRWRDREHLGWAAQFRFEWIHEVGARRRTVPGKKGGLFSKPGSPESSDVLYFRLRVPHGATCELSLPGSAIPGGDARKTAHTLAESVAAERKGATVVVEMEPSEAQYGLGGGRHSTEVTYGYEIAGSVPFSLPAALHGGIW